VAIKHIPKVDVEYEPLVLDGVIHLIPLEVYLMLRAAGGPESLGRSAAVTLLDWFDLEHELLLVMERPVPSMDLLSFIEDKGPLSEDQAKDIMKQLVEGAIQMHSLKVFHRDIKTENVLVETGSDVPRVRIIDFGCGCFINNEPLRSFSGTSAFVPPEFKAHGEYEAEPTTVWQLGALLYEIMDGHKQFSTSKFLRNKIKFSHTLSKDCHDFLNGCLALNPKERATLEQMRLHP
ncbi:serine/threonine-protein kinase pim-3-like, partial [Plectropomus leopardus]|uniref:serine/threonine-protein kinase pim-3-like n=1 Tax=Plectropomus leopardus TaxID=160734 RepID=UPI001C4A9283